MIFDRIVEFLLSMWDGFVAWLGSLVPPPPAWLTEWPATVHQYAVPLMALSPFIPYLLLSTVLLLWFACLVIGVTIKLGRIGLSFATAGGGSAG